MAIMTANKLAKRVIKANKRHVKEERKRIKLTVSSIADLGENKANIEIKFAENLEWLKKKGFKIEEGEYFYSSCRISWEDC